MLQTRYNEQERKSFVQRYLESNLSKAEFCRLNKIAHSTIYKWLKRYGKEVASAVVNTVPLHSSILL